MKKTFKESVIVSNPKIMHGKPCIKGTRIPVSLLLEMVAGGQTKKEILKEYPQLKEKDIDSVIKYGVNLAIQDIELDL